MSHSSLITYDIIVVQTLFKYRVTMKTCARTYNYYTDRNDISHANKNPITKHNVKLTPRLCQTRHYKYGHLNLLNFKFNFSIKRPLGLKVVIGKGIIYISRIYRHKCLLWFIFMVFQSFYIMGLWRCYDVHCSIIFCFFCKIEISSWFRNILQLTKAMIVCLEYVLT